MGDRIHSPSLLAPPRAILRAGAPINASTLEAPGHAWRVLRVALDGLALAASWEEGEGGRELSVPVSPPSPLSSPPYAASHTRIDKRFFRLQRRAKRHERDAVKE